MSANQLCPMLNATGLILAFAGAAWIWWISHREGPGLPFYANEEILQEIHQHNKNRQVLKNEAMGLIAIGFLFQLLAIALSWLSGGL